jgi:hypothetical protein
MMVSDEQLSAALGATTNYFIKGGDYKSEMNGKVMVWQIYQNKENKLYNKMSTVKTIYWNDGAENKDKVLKSEFQKDATTILGYKCDKLVLKCTSGTQTYFFSSQLGLDASVFAKHKFGNWADYVAAAKAVPLKMVVETDEFTMESEATAVKPMKLPANTFELPDDAKTEKSPF